MWVGNLDRPRTGTRHKRNDKGGSQMPGADPRSSMPGHRAHYIAQQLRPVAINDYSAVTAPEGNRTGASVKTPGQLPENEAPGNTKVRRLRIKGPGPAFRWAATGFLLGAAFWHFVGFWDFIGRVVLPDGNKIATINQSNIAVAGPSTAQRSVRTIGEANAATGIAAASIVAAIDLERGCTSLLRNPDTGKTTASPCDRDVRALANDKSRLNENPSTGDGGSEKRPASSSRKTDLWAPRVIQTSRNWISTQR